MIEGPIGFKVILQSIYENGSVFYSPFFHLLKSKER